VNTERVAAALRQALLTVRTAVTSREESSILNSVFDAIARAEAVLESGDGGAAISSRRSVQHALEQRVAELESAVQARDEFLSTLGHELRNPLSPIFMQAQYLLDVVRSAEGRPISTDWLAARLETFCRRLHKLLDTLNRIMDVSRINAGRVSLTLETFDLAEVIIDLCAGFERELSLAKSVLHVDATPPLVGRWDRMRIEQILTNLVSNAIRYGASKPIVVSARADAHSLQLRVRDHGIGIEKEDQARIFQRFEQVIGKRRSGGYGIGLWIVQQSCLAMGGKVEVHSEKGKGSEFVVTLPRYVEGQND
jgi:signal transduction histidine kinase